MVTNEDDSQRERLDPRVERTKLHVLAVAREMYASGNAANLTFVSLAAEAKVSRRTLYAHWGTLDAVLVDALARFGAIEAEEPEAEPSGRERLRTFLRMIRDGNANPIVLAGMLSLAAQFNQSKMTDDPMPAPNLEWLAAFRDVVGPATESQYAQLVGAVIFQEMMGAGSPSDAFIDELVVRGAEVLRLD